MLGVCCGAFLLRDSLLQRHPHDLYLASLGCSAFVAAPFCFVTHFCSGTPATCTSHPWDARRCCGTLLLRDSLLQRHPHDLYLASLGCSAFVAAPFCFVTHFCSGTPATCTSHPWDARRCCGTLLLRDSLLQRHPRPVPRILGMLGVCCSAFLLRDSLLQRHPHDLYRILGMLGVCCGTFCFVTHFCGTPTTCTSLPRPIDM